MLAGQSLEIHTFFVSPYGVHASPKMLPLQIKKSVLFLVRPFSRILDHVERFFLNLGPHLESFLLPWRHFWEHFGSIFGVKNETVAPKVPQERPKAPTTKIPSRFGSHVGVAFCRFSDLFFKKQGCKICVCKGAVFLWFLDPLKLARKGSRSSPSTIFAYSPSSKKVPKRDQNWYHFGSHFPLNSDISAFQKMLQKKVPRKSETSPY